jgi:hypothetical protein
VIGEKTMTEDMIVEIEEVLVHHRGVGRHIRTIVTAHLLLK